MAQLAKLSDTQVVGQGFKSLPDLSKALKIIFTSDLIQFCINKLSVLIKQWMFIMRAASKGH